MKSHLKDYRKPSGGSSGSGTRGATGLSAYEIAVVNGFVGSQVAWLNSLNGYPTTERRTEIELMFKVAESSSYKEINYTNGNISSIDVYTESNKTVKLFTKTIGYNNGNIINVSITDEVNGGTLNKAINYTDGNISSIGSNYVE